jgi:hypothetical protein
VKQIGAGAARFVKGFLSAVGIAALALAWGYVHQLMSFAECSPGKPAMSWGAIILSAIGLGTTCSR